LSAVKSCTKKSPSDCPNDEPAARVSVTPTTYLKRSERSALP
jgi:hypothetical protein